MIDFFFYSFMAVFTVLVILVLLKLRCLPIYEPRVIFSLASLTWLSIIYGYSVGYNNYLAFETIIYERDIYVLSTYVSLLFIFGYLSFIIGGSFTYQFDNSLSRRPVNLKVVNILALMCVFLAFLNFYINVILMSNGSIVDYLMSTAGRSYQIAEGKGISTIGYMLGHVGICALLYSRANTTSKVEKLCLFILIFVMLTIKASQGRVFQTLVLLGACFFSSLLGKDEKSSYLSQIKYLVLFVALGLAMYFMRIASAMHYQGLSVESIPLETLSDGLIHFAFERGNLPNIPVVLTIIDKVPDENFYLSGKSIFNWLIGVLPPELFSSDFLVSMWIKKQWYVEIEGGGLPPTAIGEWYLNFGVVGVIVGMFLVGHVLGNIYKYVKVRKSVFSSILWANIAFGFLIIYPKTDLAQVPTFTVVFCFIFYFLYIILKKVLVNEKN